MAEDYSKDPVRSSVYVVNSEQPFNAEPPAGILRENFITPNDSFFIRNHAPVPHMCESTYAFFVDGAVQSPMRFTMEDIYKLPTCCVTMTVSCAGNRRTEMSNFRPVKGVGWGCTALSNAVWEGPLLRDILMQAGVIEDMTLHVECEGWDLPLRAEGAGYTVSIPLSKALDVNGDVILAYRMNGAPLPRDHGYPLRVIVPGYIGARCTKWLKRISVISEESKAVFQARDYKLLPPQVNWGNVSEYLDKMTPIYSLNVQSAICDPIKGQAVDPGKPYTIKGYAVSGGHRIIRVDVSLDDGKNWELANVLPCEKKGATNRCWSWSFWELPVASMPSPTTIVCRALDFSSNTQPENVSSIWNLVGLMNNSYHRVTVKSAEALP